MHSSSNKTNPRDEFHELARKAKLQNTLEACNLALEAYFKIEKKNSDDERHVASIRRKMAIIYFNMAEFRNAAENYALAAENYALAAWHLSQIQNYPSTFFVNNSLTDLDYRKMIRNYVDLSDAYLGLDKKDAADDAFAKAVTALHAIKLKTDAENKVIMAAKKDDYRSFRQLIEDDTCTKSYLTSKRYETGKETLFERRDENSLVKGINTLFSPTPKPVNNSARSNEPVLVQTSIEQYTTQIIPDQNRFAFGIFAAQPRPTVDPLWGARQQINNTQDDDPQSGLGMELC